ncbi:MAG: dihydrofolate reductase family protein [Oenococcus sp.]|uniref:dihydrofolate reductase family protein n=1 Tax=Oenococcus TaxID=46254 RepID=UPI0021E6E833|nr:dihydrofolate reductase family protein [Oenococcus kitaharae]MCV3295897.1 dihydrofolate reductase family protein [Oenococcus kitaharae]
MTSKTMRKVFFYGAISLDGFLAREDDSLQWLFDTELDPDYSIVDFEAGIDTVVMGNTTYKETHKILGDTPMFPGKEKIVFSRSQTGSVADGGRYVSGDPPAIVSDLKSAKGKNIWIVGGGTIVTQLVRQDLIDEFWIQIAPILIGRGKRLFEEADYEKRLSLIGIKRIDQLTELHLKRE